MIKAVNFRTGVIGAVLLTALACSCLAAPVIDPLANVTIATGKSLILPVTASSSSGQPLTYTITSSAPGIAVVMHTNNPFWQLTVAQAASNTAPGAYKTPYRGGLVSVTNVGVMTFMLFPEYAPHTVNVFQGLTTSGFFNSNTIFHRVVSNFVIQGGDPLTNGMGGLAFQYNDEFNPQAIFSGNGQLALANSGKNTDGSQFFVTVGPQRSLDFGYTLFGQLVRGFPILTNIESTMVDANSRPLADEIIQLAGYVTNTTDTVLTLTATNVSGINSTIIVIADDGAGGRATNTFTATTTTDASSNNQPFFFPNNFATNLAGPANTILTNFLNAIELDGEPLYWFPEFTSQASASAAPGSSYSLSNSILQTLTYEVTNAQGELKLFLVPSNNYAGPVSIAFIVSGNSQWNLYQEDGFSLPNYAEQVYTFVFGDTAIAGQANPVTVLTSTSITNALLATFTNGVPGSAATNFTAAINWGDNSIDSGSITTNSTGQKNVFGSHRYPYPGNYPVYVQVQSSVGAATTILSRVTAISTLPKLTATAGPATNGFSFNVQLPAGVNGFVQVSTNLSSWTAFTNFIGTSPTISLHDPAATNVVRRFYRVLIP